MKIKSIQFETWFDENIDEWFDPKMKLFWSEKENNKQVNWKVVQRTMTPETNPKKVKNICFAWLYNAGNIMTRFKRSRD